MEGKASLCKVLRSLFDLEVNLPREILIDYLMGRPTQDIEQSGLDNTENYGCGDDKDEEHWNLIIEKAIEEGYLKVKSTGVSIMAKGKKYLKKPVSFEVDEDDEEESFDGSNIDGLVADVLSDDETIKPTKVQNTKSITSQRKINLIQAIDRHIALDEYASDHGFEFSEVLDDIETLMATGMKLDITYFGLEVLGSEAMDELSDYFQSNQSNTIYDALSEYGDVYTADELRLGRIIWQTNKI